MNKKEKSMSTRKLVNNIIVHVFLTVLAIIWVLPIAWVVLTAFRKEPGSYLTYIMPKGYTLDNFINLLTKTNVINFPRWFMNTLIVAICSCIISTFFVLSVSYCMSRLRFSFRKTYMNIALILGMFPGFMSMIAVYYILKGIGLIDGPGALKLLSLVIVYSAGAGLSFYVAKGFFDTIPKALDEAAYLDGATKFQVFTKVTMPLSKPIIVYTILTTFMAPWLDFIFAKVIIGTNTKYYTVAIGLWNLLEREYIYKYFTQFAAGAVLVSIPVAVLFMFMQKYYVDGLSGAVKG
ncbi:MAG: sugar ABC transporter permease [Lachnospiraceae bacterium]|nr:sugar ABC transporter permease [Lachnospiraceae bacterium]MEE1341502.1 sugar ABC transporter permease [Lachnospiraceae bacterium]